MTAVSPQPDAPFATTDRATEEAAKHGDTPPVLQVSGLSVDYGVGGEAVHAVHDADLVVKRGSTLGLAGESGSGKSTLVYAITRLLRAPGVVTGGQALLTVTGPTGSPETVDLLAASAGDLRKLRWSEVSVVPQGSMSALNPVMRVGSQFTDVLAAHRPDMSKADRKARAAELMDMVGVSASRLRAYPHELSGGQRQRVTIALALTLQPQLVVLDEPTTALDVVTQREVIEKLTELQDQLGFAMLFITHDLSLLIEVADDIAIMYAGRVVERAPAEELRTSARHPYTLGLLGSFPPMHGPIERMTGIGGAPPDLRTVLRGCPFHPRCNRVMDRCRVERPPLFDLAGGDFAEGDHLAACWLLDPAGGEAS